MIDAVQKCYALRFHASAWMTVVERMDARAVSNGRRAGAPVRCEWRLGAPCTCRRGVLRRCRGAARCDALTAYCARDPRDRSDSERRRAGGVGTEIGSRGSQRERPEQTPVAVRVRCTVSVSPLSKLCKRHQYYSQPVTRQRIRHVGGESGGVCTGTHTHAHGRLGLWNRAAWGRPAPSSPLPRVSLISRGLPEATRTWARAPRHELVSHAWRPRCRRRCASWARAARLGPWRGRGS